MQNLGCTVVLIDKSLWFQYTTLWFWCVWRSPTSPNSCGNVQKHGHSLWFQVNDRYGKISGDPLNLAMKQSILSWTQLLDCNSSADQVPSSLEGHKGVVALSWRESIEFVGWKVLFFFYPRPVLAFGYCRCLRLSVCVCVRPCVNHELVRAITHDPYQLGSPNLDRKCKRPWLRSLLFWGVIDLDLQGQI